jgi:hypothetical protein
VWGGGGSQAGSLQQQQQHLSLSMRCVGCFGAPLLNQFDCFLISTRKKKKKKELFFIFFLNWFGGLD